MSDKSTEINMEELYKLIRELPAEQQADLINKLVSSSGLVVIMSNGCVTNNSISVGGVKEIADKLDAIAEDIRKIGK